MKQITHENHGKAFFSRGGKMLINVIEISVSIADLCSLQFSLMWLQTFIIWCYLCFLAKNIS